MSDGRKDALVTESEVSEVLAKAEPIARTSMVEGRRPSEPGEGGGASPFSMLVMFTGTTEDEQNYGRNHTRGDWLHGLTGELLGTPGKMNQAGNAIADPSVVEICPLKAFASYVKFVKGKRDPEYAYDSWESVPPEHQGDFLWTEDADGVRHPPIGTEVINCVTLVRGQPGPFLIRFKRSAMEAWSGKRGIEKFLREFGPCWFVLSSTTERNAEDQPYQKMHARFLAKVMADSPEMEQIRAVEAAWKEWRTRATELQEEATHREAASQADDDMPF